jgi:hypothetical protein
MVIDLEEVKVHFDLTTTAGIALIGIIIGSFLNNIGLQLEGGALAVLMFGPLYYLLDKLLLPGLMFGPAVVVYVMHVLGYAIGPLGQHYLLTTQLFNNDGMILGQWGAVIGLATFAAVYFTVFKKLHARLLRTNTPPEGVPSSVDWEDYTKIFIAIAFFILVFGTVSGALRRIGGLPEDTALSTLTIVAVFSDIITIVFFFMGFLAIKNGGAWKITWLVSYSSFTVFYSLQGSRGPIIVAFVLSALGAVWAGLSPKRVLIALAIATVIFVPFSSILSAYRSDDAYTSQYGTGIGGQTSALVTATQDYINGTGNGGQPGVAAFLYAVSALTVDRVMILHPDTLPFDGFQDVDAVLYSWVPKVIYPNRPEIGDGNTLAFRYGQGSDNGTTFAYIPSVGEGYRRFGWIGIPFMYTLTGLIYGGLMALAWAKRQKREWVAMLVFLIVEAQSIWSMTLKYALYFLIFFVVKYYIFFFVIKKLQEGSAGRWEVLQMRRQKTNQAAAKPEPPNI